MKSRACNSITLISIGLLLCGALHAGISPLKLTNFKVGFSNTTPKAFTNSNSIEIGWSPILDLKVVALRGDLSIFSAKRNPDSKFMITNYEAYLMLPILPLITVEAGGGMQNWHGQGGISPVASAGLMIRIGEVIDRLYFNYSYLFAKDNQTKEIRVGIGLNF